MTQPASMSCWMEKVVEGMERKVEEEMMGRMNRGGMVTAETLPWAL